MGPRRRVPIMKHSHLVRVTRLTHPEEFDFSFAFGFRLIQLNYEFNLLGRGDPAPTGENSFHAGRATAGRPSGSGTLQVCSGPGS